MSNATTKSVRRMLVGSQCLEPLYGRALEQAVQASYPGLPVEPYASSTARFFMYHNLEGYMRMSSVLIDLPPVTNTTNNNKNRKFNNEELRTSTD